MADRECSIAGCVSPVLARGWCRAHYKRWEKFGDPTAGGRRRLGFWANVDYDGPNGCWEWTSSRTALGYGRCSRGPGKQFSKYAHRRAWQMAFGSVPEGLVLDHLCRNPPCLNLDHLEPVVHRENVMRGLSGIRPPHCPQGHPYEGDNLYVWNGKFFCRACNREASRRYNEKRRLKA